MATPALTWSSNATPILQDIEKILAGFKRIQDAAANLGKGKTALAAKDLGTAYKQSADQIIKNIGRAEQAITQLQRKQALFSKGGRRSAQQYATGDAAKYLASATGQPQPKSIFSQVFPTGDKASGSAAFKQAIAEARAEVAKLETSLVSLNQTTREQQLLAAKAVSPQLYRELNRLTLQRGDHERRAARLTSGDAVNDALQQRTGALKEQLSLLQSQRSELIANSKAQLPRKQQQEVERAAKAREDELYATKQQAAALKQIDSIQQKAGVGRARRAGMFGGLDPKNAAQMAEILKSVGTADPAAVKGLQEQIGLATKYGEAVADAQQAQKKGYQELSNAQRIVGNDPAIQHLNQQIANVRSGLAATVTASTESLFPGLEKDIQKLEEIDRKLQLLQGRNAAEAKRLEAERGQVLASAEGRVAAGARPGTIAQPLTPEQMKQELMRKLPALERTFANVFSDMQRRFIATFQFAISGALIFGTTRLIKEFVQTAIEVERAFADIESALEFDIPEPRGTAAFKSQVEEVRQQVLGLANDFNVLPTEANKAAYTMIARFSDLNNAMRATRAQLLATKISTIEQGETLRALTAVAEGFAVEQLEINDTMALSERLLRKEAASAKLYSKALDGAVYIQQRFGIEVEDTLEGTARATEVFRQMGFSIEETQAIIAATSRQLGQTGQQAAERLVRSLGQLTDPKIMNALLDLAAGSEEFSLSISDFGSGAQAWEVITRQFSKLERTSPEVARSILQIVGQRRELEAVAAALGTSDLQAATVVGLEQAAGAAERRFSFLSQTVSEMMLSIKTGFQELAQNFERLGGLTTLKALVKTIDSTITAMNTLTKIVLDFVKALDNISVAGFGLGSMATQFAAVGLAAAGALRIVVALQKSILLLTGTAGLAKLAGMMGLGGVAVAAAGAGSAGHISTLTGNPIGFGPPIPAATTATAGSRIAAMGVAAKGATASMLAAVPVWGWVAAAGLTAAISMRGLADRTELLTESFREGSANVSAAGIEARRQIREEGLEGAEADLRFQEIVLEALKQNVATTPSGSPSVQNWIGAILTDISTLIGAAQSGDFGRLRDYGATQQVEGAFRAPSGVAGATEFWQAATDEALAEFIATQGEVLRKEMAGFDLSDFDYAGLAEEDQDALRALGGGVANPFDIMAQVNQKFAEAAQAFADEDPETGALLALEGQEKWERFLSIIGAVPARMTKSMNLLTKELDGLDAQVALGEISPSAASDQRFRIAEDMQKLAEEAKEMWPDLSDVWEQMFQDARDALLGGITSAASELRRQADIGGGVGEGEIEALQRKIELFEGSELTIPKRVEVAPGIFIERLTEEGENILRETEDMVRELAIAEANLAITIAQHAVEMAEGLEEEQAARNALNDAYRAAIELYEDYGNEAKVGEYEREIEKNARAATKDSSDDARKLAEARVRMSGPILDPILAIQAQIAGIRAELAAGGLEAGERAALGVQLNEAIARESQAQMAKIRAYAESQIGARNAMKANQLELTLLVRELALTARLFGEGSAEWSKVAKGIVNVKAALMDQALELEHINRLMEGDLTDPYFKTQAALIDAIQRQRAVYDDEDAGDLEKARADLAVMEAEIADQAAHAENLLFTLKFDLDRGAITKSQYIASLKRYRDEVDTTSRAGKELWQELTGLIEGMESDVGDMQFNIPGEIRLPTLFEVRRSLAADALGVNYQDNRTQDIRIFVSSDVDVAKVADAVNEGLGSQAASASARYAPGSATITLGI